MDDLHAAIAAYLHRQRRARALLRQHEERHGPPRCKVCGAVVDDDEGGLYNLEDMRVVRECRAHYVPF